MKNYKFITVLKTFSKEETVKFEKFLNSPYFSVKPYTVPFFKEIMKYYPSFDEGFSMENVWGKVYKGTAYNDTTARKILSLLLNYACEFIKVETSMLDSTHRKIEAAHVYISRNLYSLAGKLLDEAEHELQSGNSHEFEILTYFEGIKIYYNVQASSQKEAAQHVFKSAKWIFLDFISKYADTIYYSHTNKQRYNIDYNKEESKLVMNMLDTSRLPSAEKNDVYSFYYKIIYYLNKIILDDDYSRLTDFYMDFRKFDKKFPGDDDGSRRLNRKVLRILNNLSAFRHGQENIWFETAKMGDEKEIIHIYKAELILRDYVAGIIPSFYTNQQKWAEKFAMKYLPRMNSEQRKQSEEFTNANLNYLRGRFDEALRNCVSVTAKDYQVGLLTKILMMKICFDTGEYEKAYSLLDAFHHYMRQNKYISAEIVNRHLPFAESFKKLLNALHSHNASIIEDNCLELRKQSFFDKDWITERYNRLK
ncbi:MAG: hypothetical protein IAE90_04100 [Ignavibacteria bacterium]|nr:hypothetical protein [Ignavibacteria bacterium]